MAPNVAGPASHEYSHPSSIKRKSPTQRPLVRRSQYRGRFQRSAVLVWPFTSHSHGLNVLGLRQLADGLAEMVNTVPRERQEDPLNKLPIQINDWKPKGEFRPSGAFFIQE